MSTPEATAVTKSVFLLIYNPRIESLGGGSLATVRGWQDPDALTTQVIQDIHDASHGLVQYRIAERREEDKFPVKQDGFVYTDETYLTCVNSGGQQCHSPDGVHYLRILQEYRMCEKVNAGSIDELWIWGGPWFGYWESALVGPGWFPYNSGYLGDTTCQKRLPIMGFNYERGVDLALHSYGHRAEATMTYVYGGWSVQSSRHVWDLYGHNRTQTPGVGPYGCGSVHYPPNGGEYDYGNSVVVASFCNDYLRYPNLQQRAEDVSCAAWGCSQYGFMKWWFSHLPHADGVTDGKLNNWWAYIADIDNTHLGI